jgi:hypothetical protein
LKERVEKRITERKGKNAAVRRNGSVDGTRKKRRKGNKY